MLMHGRWYMGVRGKHLQYCEWRMRKTPAKALKYTATGRRVHCI